MTENSVRGLIFSDSKFDHWKSKITANGVILERVDCVGEVTRDGKRAYAALIDCWLKTPEGRYPQCVVLRGNTVVVIPILNCPENGGEYTLLVEQRRIAQGEVIQEFPAGMVDRDRNDPVGAAVTEIKEELGIDVDPSELIPLSDIPINTVPSLTDEVAHFFCFKREMSMDSLVEINGRRTGLFEENEFIHVRVEALSNVMSLSTTLAMLAGIKLVENQLGRPFLQPSQPLNL